MPISHVRDGPIHLQGLWSNNKEIKCVCKRGQCVSWEARLTYTVTYRKNSNALLHSAGTTIRGPSGLCLENRVRERVKIYNYLDRLCGERSVRVLEYFPLTGLGHSESVVDVHSSHAIRTISCQARGDDPTGCRLLSVVKGVVRLVLLTQNGHPVGHAQVTEAMKSRGSGGDVPFIQYREDETRTPEAGVAYDLSDPFLSGKVDAEDLGDQPHYYSYAAEVVHCDERYSISDKPVPAEPHEPPEDLESEEDFQFEDSPITGGFGGSFGRRRAHAPRSASPLLYPNWRSGEVSPHRLRSD